MSHPSTAFLPSKIFQLFGVVAVAGLCTESFQYPDLGQTPS